MCSLNNDAAKTASEVRELADEIASLQAELEAEHNVQIAAKERLALLQDDKQVDLSTQLHVVMFHV